MDLTTTAGYRNATSILVSRALRDLEAVWRTFDVTDGVGVRVVLEAVLPDLVATYGSAVATLAAQRFEAMRDAARVPGRFTARPAPPPVPERVNASMRAVIKPLFQAAPDGPLALQEVGGVLSRFIKEPGRETIVQNTRRDRYAIGYRRRPTGPTTCGFCLMLASRLDLYESKQAATRRASDGGRYHTRCDCEPEAVYDFEAHRRDPQRLDLERTYKDAVSKVGHDPDDITHYLRTGRTERQRKSS